VDYDALVKRFGQDQADLIVSQMNSDPRLQRFTPQRLNQMRDDAIGVFGTIKAPEMTIPRFIEDGASRGFERLGMEPRRARRYGGDLRSIAEFFTPIGDAIGFENASNLFDDAQRQVEGENYFRAAADYSLGATEGVLAAIGSIGGPIGKGIARRGRGLLGSNLRNRPNTSSVMDQIATPNPRAVVGGNMPPSLIGETNYGGVRNVDPMAEKAMAEHLRMNRQANIKKVLKSGRTASPNFFDEEAAEELASEIRNKQASRDVFRGLLDREGKYLRDDAGNLPYYTENKLNEFRANKLVNDASKRLNWNKGLIKDIIQEERIYAPDAYRFYVNKKATDATIEAIERGAKKKGWKVAHRSGRATKGGSRYIEVPEKGQVRISDHELPDTPRRSDIMQNRGYDWVDELIVGNEWKKRTIEDYLDEIELLASQ